MGDPQDPSASWYTTDCKVMISRPRIKECGTARYTYMSLLMMMMMPAQYSTCPHLCIALLIHAVLWLEGGKPQLRRILLRNRFNTENPKYYGYCVDTIVTARHARRHATILVQIKKQQSIAEDVNSANASILACSVTSTVDLPTWQTPV